MATYMLLIYGNEQQWEAMTPEESERFEEGHRAFVAAVDAAGSAVLGSHPLEASATATTLRGDARGRPAVTDGPFLETAEALGGYYMLEVPDRDAAVALAQRLPELAMAHCAVEIRPVRDLA